MLNKNAFRTEKGASQDTTIVFLSCVCVFNTHGHKQTREILSLKYKEMEKYWFNLSNYPHK